MNERIIKLGLQSGMLNYIDNETPRHYFLCGLADERCLEKFALLIIRECAEIVEGSSLPDAYSEPCLKLIADDIRGHFGVES